MRRMNLDAAQPDRLRRRLRESVRQDLHLRNRQRPARQSRQRQRARPARVRDRRMRHRPRVTQLRPEQRIVRPACFRQSLKCRHIAIGAKDQIAGFYC